jgi:hypothetical protein
VKDINTNMDEYAKNFLGDIFGSDMPFDVWMYLVTIGKHDIIELLNKAEKKQICVVRIKRDLVPNRKYNNMILEYLGGCGVKLIYGDQHYE